MPVEKIVTYRIELFLEEHAEIEDTLNNFSNPSKESPQLYKLWIKYISGLTASFSPSQYESLIKELERVEREFGLKEYIYSFYNSLLEAK